MTFLRIPLLALLLLAAAKVPAQTSATPAPTRGELLYRTHCSQCHTTQMHWREKRLATDWASLAAQVRRWQANAGLGWPESTVLEVVNYLNATIYKFPDDAPKQKG
ncbi:MAG: cytochrome C [Casimicrobiaceae bacterium]